MFRESGRQYSIVTRTVTLINIYKLRIGVPTVCDQAKILVPPNRKLISS